MPFPNRIIRSPHTIGALVAFASLCVYLKTLAPSVDFIDAGELSTVAWTLGIAHPTGYPLWTLIAWCFVHLPFPMEPVIRLNLLATLFCAAGAYVFFHVMLLLLREAFAATETTIEWILYAASAGATLLLAFSGTYWSQAVATEVYSLHALCLSVVLYTFLKANEKIASPEARTDRWWLLFAYTWGLSFGNHMTTVLLAPGLIVYYFLRQGLTARSWKRLGLMVVPFLLGVSVYLYLPIRASQNPIMNWGDPTSLQRTFQHVSGFQFRSLIFQSAAAAEKQFAHFLKSYPSEHAYIGLLLAIPGIVLLFRRSWKIGLLTLILFLTCVGYSSSYNIRDIDSYFLLAYFVTALWVGCTLFVLAAWLVRKTVLHPTVIAVLTVLVGLIPLTYHFTTLDESNNHLVEDYTLNMFRSMETNAIVFSYQWDYWVSAAYYMQLVQTTRPDIVVIDTELLHRSWYIKQLEQRFPRLMDRSRNEINTYLPELYKFEEKLPYRGAMLQAGFDSLARSFIIRNIVDRPVYITPEIEDRLTEGFQRVPAGLAIRLYADTVYHSPLFPRFEYRHFDRSGRLENDTRAIYADAFVFRGLYFYNWSLNAEAEKAFQTALSYDPTRSSALQWLRYIQSHAR